MVREARVSNGEYLCLGLPILLYPVGILGSWKVGEIMIDDLCIFQEDVGS